MLHKIVKKAIWMNLTANILLQSAISDASELRTKTTMDRIKVRLEYFKLFKRFVHDCCASWVWTCKTKMTTRWTAHLLKVW